MCEYGWFTFEHIKFEVHEGQPGMCVCVYTYEILLSAGIQTSAFSPHVPPIRVDLFLKPNTVLFFIRVLVPDFSF